MQTPDSNLPTPDSIKMLRQILRLRIYKARTHTGQTLPKARPEPCRNRICQDCQNCPV